MTIEVTRYPSFVMDVPDDQTMETDMFKKRESETPATAVDLIDLGTASVETRGSEDGLAPDGVQGQKFPIPGQLVD